jgi:hypothetical protein
VRLEPTIFLAVRAHCVYPRQSVGLGPTVRENKTTMAYFRVLLNGENFWLHMEGRPRCMGFFTTRFVEARTPDEAELAAVDLLRSEGKLKPLNDPSDSPRVFASEIEAIEEADVPPVARGFTFFPDEGGGQVS